MKAVALSRIQAFNYAYLKDDKQTILRRVLVKNSLDSIAYKNEVDTNTQFKFSIDIPTLPVTNQKASGRCWLFAGLNVLREQIAVKYGLKDFELSQNYQAFWDKFEKINYFLESIDDFLTCDSDDRILKHILTQGIQDGGQWDMFVSLVLKYGVVPKEAMPETFASSNTAYMNRLINFQLRKYVADARHLASLNQYAEKDALKASVLEKLYGFLVSSFGIPPQSFDFEYVNKDSVYHKESNLNPVKFYESVGFDLNDYVSIITSPTSDKPYGKSYTIDYLGNVVDGKMVRHLNLEMKRVTDLIIAQLQNKEIVWFGSDVAREGDREKGVWDDQAYDFDTPIGLTFKMSKADRLDYLQGAMNHAMVITGVNLENGKPTKWKIENSWGSDRGLKGYYLMSDTWFQENTYQAVIHKKYLLKEEMDAYLSKPIILKPWDPMGSLA